MSQQAQKPNYDRIKMMALSLYAPWPWAIFHGEPRKDIENRGWFTHYTGWLAIHQGKKVISRDYFESFLAMYRHVGGDLATVPHREDFQLGQIVGVARMVGCVKRHESPWFEGEYGFVLADPIALPQLIPVNGSMGLWSIPQPERNQLLDQVVDKMRAVERRIIEETASV